VATLLAFRALPVSDPRNAANAALFLGRHLGFAADEARALPDQQCIRFLGRGSSSDKRCGQGKECEQLLH
jgi:hypothetical protein